MAIYDGETVRITATCTDVTGTSLGSGDVSSAFVNLYDPSGNYVFQEVDLTWDATTGYWYYDWQNALPGSFTAQCVFIGTGFEAFNYGTIRVSSLKVTPTGQPTTITN